MDIAQPHKKIIYMAVLFLVSISVAILSFIYFQSTTRAADLSKFDPGNIMSDDVMSNHTAMSVQQIQAFLESKNACNNTNTYLASYYPHLQYNIKDGKFVCMAKDSFNGESAAQIIWQAARDYEINPQVLIIILQKEQGLVTDTWPNHLQYRSATGYGCSDTAACDSQYYGLKNQVRLTAASFRRILNGGGSNYPVGTNYILYNPNRACGGSNVAIQNRATSALYNYTPYQPNQSSLAAGYSDGDSCGAYGNRNFWLWFNDWFGSTQTSISKPLTSKATDTLTTGDTLKPGEFISSADGSYMLIMQYSGQLVLYRSGLAIWQSSSINMDEQGASFVLQSDGNMVLYKGGSATWGSGTDGKGGTKLILQDDGNLVLYTADSKPVWGSDTSYSTKTSTKYMGSQLSKGTRLNTNEYLRSPDWRYFLVMQSDGNLVLYTAGHAHALWGSGTDGKGGKYVTMQNDGNLVIYSDSKALWGSGTDGKGIGKLSLQSDGNLVLYNTAERPLWGSGTDGKGGKYVTMQNDGNLVIYSDSKALWGSGTDGKGGTYVSMQNDGNLVVYSNTRPLWGSGTDGKGGGNTKYDDCTLAGNLQSGNQLKATEFLCSSNLLYKLIMQSDGNLVMYYKVTSANWSSGTNDKFFKSNLAL